MTNQEHDRILSELLLEREKLQSKFRIAERQVRDRAGELAKLGERLITHTHVFTVDDQQILEKAPELTALIHDYLAMRKRLQELNQALGE